MSFSHDPRINDLAARVAAGERLSFADGLALYATDDLAALAKLADTVRRRLHERRTYFNVNRHFNPTNVCYVDCKECRAGAPRVGRSDVADGRVLLRGAR